MKPTGTLGSSCWKLADCRNLAMVEGRDDPWTTALTSFDKTSWTTQTMSINFIRKYTWNCTNKNDWCHCTASAGCGVCGLPVAGAVRKVASLALPTVFLETLVSDRGCGVRCGTKPNEAVALPAGARLCSRGPTLLLARRDDGALVGKRLSDVLQ